MKYQNATRKYNKVILNESISEIVYHFTDFSSAWSICTTNKFQLTTGFQSKDDNLHNRGRLFYLCTTRNHSSQIGYVGTRNKLMSQQNRTNELWNEKNRSLINQGAETRKPIASLLTVRFELDGMAINQRYKGFPVDFLRMTNNSNILVNAGVGKFVTKKVNGKLVNQYVETNPENRITQNETEDRIVSDKSYIDNADKYIRRVDILLNPNILNSNGKSIHDVFARIGDILRSKVGNRVFLYDNEKDFDTVHSTHSVNDEFLMRASQKFPELVNAIQGQSEFSKNVLSNSGLDNKYNSPSHVNPTQCEMISYFLAFVLMGEVPQEEYQIEAYNILQKYKLDDLVLKDGSSAVKLILQNVNNFSITDINRVGQKLSRSKSVFKGARRDILGKLMEIFGKYLKKRGINDATQIVKFKQNLIRNEQLNEMVIRTVLKKIKNSLL